MINGHRPSEDRIGWTSSTLNYALPVLHSIKNLQIKRKEKLYNYQKDTQKEADLFLQHINQKIMENSPDLRFSVDFDCYFWLDPEDRLPNIRQPSAKLNKSYTDSNEYVDRHYKTIVKQKPNNQEEKPEEDEEEDEYDLDEYSF